MAAGLGICKDTGAAQHVAGVAALNVDAYLAGLVHRPQELPEQGARGVVIARACGAFVVLASFAGPTGDVYTGDGRSVGHLLGGRPSRRPDRTGPRRRCPGHLHLRPSRCRIPSGTELTHGVEGAVHDLRGHGISESLVQADGTAVGCEHVEADFGDPETALGLRFGQANRLSCMPLAARARTARRSSLRLGGAVGASDHDGADMETTRAWHPVQLVRVDVHVVAQPCVQAVTGARLSSRRSGSQPKLYLPVRGVRPRITLSGRARHSSSWGTAATAERSGRRRPTPRDSRWPARR